jgi:5-methylcytosine-specific restriction endonuclease McrA
MGMTRRDYANHSAKVCRSKRWPALRLQAKRRDGFACVKCGATGDLEVDHVKPVRDAPELSFEITNLQTLCIRCHSAKTRIEVGWADIDPKRQAWRDLVRAIAQPKPKDKLCWNL